MITQVAFKTDNELKKSALQKARREGVTLKAVLTYFMRSYVQGDIEIGVIHRDSEGFTKQACESILATAKDPKNISTGEFETKDELFAHLDTFAK